MSAKQDFGDNRIKIKKIALYGVLTALCLVFGYIEALFPLFFIAPGVKLGLANTVALILAVKGDFKGALLVNCARISLSALLFGSVVSFAFSFTAGLFSLALVIIFTKTKVFSTVGVSISGGVCHNLVQCVVALFVTGVGVVYYLPVLLISGAVAGAVTGVVCNLILKKIKTNR